MHSMCCIDAQLRCSHLLKVKHVRRARLLARNADVLVNWNSSQSSAKWVDIGRSGKRKLYVRIKHDALRNCIPEMLRWWFQNLGRYTTWDGIDLGGLGFVVGEHSRITEQFNDHREKIDVTVVFFHRRR